MNKYDIHTHILPNIDDGAKNIDESLALLKKLSNQGVTHIALTPHYYSNKESIEDFLESRRKSYCEFIKSAPKNIKYSLGAEVYVSEYIFNNKSLEDVCYSNTDKILLEFPYSSSFTGKSRDMLFKIMSNYSVKPILAHIERYDALLNHIDLVEELVDNGCEMQINLSSLTTFSVRRKLLKMFKNGFIGHVGTDTHSFKKGSDFNTGYEILQKKFENIDEVLQYNSKSIFNK